MLPDPVPFAVTAARGLRALATYTMGLPGSGCLYCLEDWPGLQSKLNFLPHLEVERGGRRLAPAGLACTGMLGC